MYKTLSEHQFSGGAINSLPVLDERNSDSLAIGSRNQIYGGEGITRPWRGMTTQGASTGARKMVQLGKTWGGLKDTGGNSAAGSLFSDIASSFWFIGLGDVSKEGSTITGLSATTLLQVAIAVAGSYDASHTYQAGLPQPSAPDVAITTTVGVGFTGQVNGPVSFKIARLRTTTGARSVASLTSAVVVAANNTIRVTFPAAGTGQTHWRVFATQEGFGGVGLHYALPYVPGGVTSSAIVDIPESTVAAGTVDGIGRSLEFDYKTGDLLPELAYIDDYPPPAGTHAMRIENVMCVLGAFVDSSSSVSSTNPGTVGAISLPNFYESYKPTDRVYFPEAVVDARSRPTDSYGYVAHKNSVTALQYVGLRNGPAVALTTVIPDVGISKAQNWCQVAGLLYMRIATGGFIRMKSDGSIDYAWAAPIWNAVKDWDDSTVVGWHPNTLSVVIMNGGDAWAFSLVTEAWSPFCLFSDAGVAGSALSAINSQGDLFITVNNSGSQTAYKWDSGASQMPISSITPWTKFRPYWPRNPWTAQEVVRQVDVRELHLLLETDRTNDPLIVALHRNTRQTFVRDAVTTNTSNSISSASMDLSNRVGDQVCVFGAGVGGTGIDYLVGTIATASGGAITIVDSGGSPVNAHASLTGLYMTVAYQIFTYSVPRANLQVGQFFKEPFMRNCQNYAVGLHLITNATAGMIHTLEVLGTIRSTGIATVT
jgi:hypothetical protein